MKFDRETRVKLQKQIKESKLSKETKDAINSLLDDTKLGLKLYFEESEETTINEDGHDVPLSSLNYTYFEEDKSKRLIINEDKPNHLLIEGDNYYALKHLKKIGQKVDIIYIDPPYNTGNEFVYNDKLVGKDDSFKHSYWLSFMKKRLELARDLMTDDGVIFVSIDDNEQAYLKVLMDEIFGESNFISTLTRTIAKGGKNNGNTFAKEHDYVIVYGKIEALNGKPVNKDGFKLDDNDGRGPYQLRDLISAPGAFERTGSQTKPIKIGNKIYEPVKSDGSPWYWRWGEERVKLGLDLGLIVEYNGKLMTKLYYNWDFKQGDKELKKKERTQLYSTTDLISSEYSNGKGSSESKSIGIDFSFPKPTSLIKFLINLIPFRNDMVILDFFAGSGTTGQAVMELNNESKEYRKFIGITLGEEVKGINICNDIAYERLFRTSKGETTDGKTNFKWLEKNDPYKENIKYLISKPLDKFNGNLNSLNINKDLYKDEFNVDLTVELIADE